MAGYFTKLNGYVYEGSYPAGEALSNGVFVEITGGKVVKLTSGNDTRFRVEEKTTLFGLPALLLSVLNTSASEFFMVENELPNLNGEEWNEAAYELPAGNLVRMKRPLPGEQFIVTTDTSRYDMAVVGGEACPADDGGIRIP